MFIGRKYELEKLNQMYKCEVCGNISEMVHTGAGELVCCGQNMQVMTANTEDAADFNLSFTKIRN